MGYLRAQKEKRVERFVYGLERTAMVGNQKCHPYLFLCSQRSIDSGIFVVFGIVREENRLNDRENFI